MASRLITATTGKWTALRNELGTCPALLYLFQKLWKRLGGKLTAYRFAYQPIPDQRSVAPAVGVEFRWLTAFEPALMVEDRKEAIVRARFDRGDRCLAAFKNGEIAAFLWLANTHYPEDDARCDYRLEPTELVWDYDVYVAPKYRVTRLFAQLWDEANAVLYREGARWSVSRISAFNSASLRSHQKRGARLTGSAFFIMLGRLQLVLASQRPRLHLSLTGRPEFRFELPKD
ncbi:MAG: GNAT family N-acetyltransferase [Pseudomonadota bacterium]